jgi:hypothetical protein
MCTLTYYLLCQVRKFSSSRPWGEECTVHMICSGQPSSDSFCKSLHRLILHKFSTTVMVFYSIILPCHFMALRWDFTADGCWPPCFHVFTTPLIYLADLKPKVPSQRLLGSSNQLLWVDFTSRILQFCALMLHISGSPMTRRDGPNSLTFRTCSNSIFRPGVLMSILTS